MTGADFSLGVLAVAALALIGVVVRRPEAAATPGGRIAAFAALFAMPGLVMLGGAVRHYEQAQTTTFCLSCHLMEPYRESLRIDDPRFLPAAHYQNRRVPVDRACYTCHTNYTMFGGVDDKVRGVRHVWHTVWGTVSDPVELYEPFENRACLTCHQGGRSYEEQAAHARYLADLREGTRSCVMCHNLAHEVAQLDRFPRWNPGEPQ